ncbi:MAG: hypothetical protein Q8R08_01680 [bacterium]|nr:hypothetical protein [bacterium]
MSDLIQIGSLILLFLFLGLAAEVVVVNVQTLGYRLRIAPFSLGLLLGVFTSFPETFIGINATLRGISTISLGNLMGGTLVLLALISGLAIVLGHTIRTTQLVPAKWRWIMGGYMILPLILISDGLLSVTDGVALVILYLLIVNGMIDHRANEHLEKAEDSSHKKISTKKALSFALIGLAGVIVISHFLVDLTMSLVERFSLPLFFTGLVGFSLGTNLPELSVAYTSWKHGIKRLALGNLMGSAFTNPFIVGVLAIMRPIETLTSLSFWIFAILLALVVFCHIWFGVTDHKFTTKEGIILLILYGLFLLIEFGCLGFASSAACVR